MPDLSSADVVRAWKDEEYRDSLPQEVRDQLPPAPENLDEMSEEQIAEATGGLRLVGPYPIPLPGGPGGPELPGPGLPPIR